MMSLRIWRWTALLDWLGGPYVIIWVRIERRQECQSEKMMTKAEARKREKSERFENTTLLASKMEEGARIQGETAASRSWKGKGTDSPKEPAKEGNLANSLIL